MIRFHLDDQIAAQPDAVRAVLGRELPRPLDPARPVLFTGEGTSLHACRIAATWVARLSNGSIRAHAIDSHTLALAAPLNRDDQVIVVSHRGTKRFPGEVLQRARTAGAVTICVSGEGAAEIPADVVIRTGPDETSATHTVSYVSALAALARLVMPLGDDTRAVEFEHALAAVADAMEATLSLPAPMTAAERLAGREPILVAGFDLDGVTADEAALKLKEGIWRWAEGMSVEAALHGPVAAYGPHGSAIVIAPASDDGGRSAALAGICSAVGMDVLRCAPGDSDLPFAEVPSWVRPMTSILPLQRLVAETARLVGSNPDSIRTDEEPWAGAMKRVRL